MAETQLMPDRDSTDPRDAWLVSRRKLLTGAAAFSAAAVGPWKIAHAGQRLVVNALTGVQSESHVKAINEPFEKKFGVKIIMDDTGVAAQDYAKIRATRGKPGWDVNATMSADFLYLGEKEGLYEPIDEKQVPNLAHVWPQMWDHLPRNCVPMSIAHAGLHYNKSKMAAPESWLDLWKPEDRYGDKLKGRLLMVRPTNLVSLYAMIMGAISAGGGVDNMEPLWEMMRKGRDNFGHVSGEIAQAEPLFDSGELLMTVQWSSRIKWFRDRGSPLEFVVPKEGTIASISGSAVPIGAEEKELAYAWMNFRLEMQPAYEFCLAYNCGPTRRDITDMFDDEFRRDNITTAEQIASLRKVDARAIGANRAAWNAQWQKIMGA